MNGVLGALHLERQRRKEFAETRFAVPGHPGGVIVREKHGECLGASVWASSQVLTRFLAARLESQNGGATRAPRVLELGCGVGLPGIFCALKGCSVTLTDRDEVGGEERERGARSACACAPQMRRSSSVPDPASPRPPIRSCVPSAGACNNPRKCARKRGGIQGARCRALVGFRPATAVCLGASALLRQTVFTPRADVLALHPVLAPAVRGLIEAQDGRARCLQSFTLRVYILRVGRRSRTTWSSVPTSCIARSIWRPCSTPFCRCSS